MITVVEGRGLRLHLAQPPPDLAPYVSLYYRTDVAPGEVVEDRVPPEWANLRAGRSCVYEAAIGDDALRAVPDIVISGPTSRAAHLRIGEGRFWGIGLLPLGFASILGVPASDYADRFADLTCEPAAEALRPLFEQLLATTPTMAEGAALMTAALRARLGRPLPQADAITRTHEAVVSDRIRTVSGLAQAVGVSTRTLERSCRRDFGFNPQMLLRRQRFLRSLACYLTDPSMTWLDSLDSHYHDQAHFLRDFRWFMGMRPSSYAALDHPITGAAVRARLTARGEAMQVLHTPAYIPAIAHDVPA